MKSFRSLLCLLIVIVGGCQTSEITSARPIDIEWFFNGAGPTTEYILPDGTLSPPFYPMMTKVGEITVLRWQGYSPPLGIFVSSEAIGPKKIDGKVTGFIKLTTYLNRDDTSKMIIGYEVPFPNCTSDNYSIYINDANKNGSIDALNYVFEKMSFNSSCDP